MGSPSNGSGVKNKAAAGRSTERPNLITGPVQICWHKFARYFDVEIREVPMEHDRLLLTPEAVIERCDENTIGVVPTLGVTFTLQYEPVEAICRALDALRTANGVRHPGPRRRGERRVSRSLPASPSSLGISACRGSSRSTSRATNSVWHRWAADGSSGARSTICPTDLIFDVNYLGGNLPTFALNFSRPGGQVICQYFNFLRLGRDGFRKVQEACSETALWLADQIANLGPFELVYNGRGGIPGVTWTLKPGAAFSGSLYDLADRLRTRGWLVPAYSMPPNCQDIVVQRILVRHGFSRDLATLLLDDLRTVPRAFRDTSCLQALNRA